MDEIIIHIAVLSAEVDESIVRSAKVENRFVGIVHENPISSFGMHPYVKWNAHVQRIVSGTISKIIRIPIGKCAARAIEVSCFFAQANELFVYLNLLEIGDFCSYPGNTQRIISIQKVSGKIKKTQSKTLQIMV